METIKQTDFCEQYLLEVENTHTFKNEKGAIWYKFRSKECHITGVWVKKELRKEGVASHLADEVAKIAKENGCTILIGKVNPKNPGATVSLLSQILYGFKLFPEILNEEIILFKEL